VNDALLRAIGSAQHDIVLQSPYLLLTPHLLKALEDASARDVRVTLLTNSPVSSDNVASQTLFVDSWTELEAAMERLFTDGGIRRVVHLAAQAGVRYSIENPHAYADSNLTGTLHVLEGCRHHGVEHLVFASTSSVYGANTKMPFSVHQNVNHPLSFYAATKKANELMAHTYAALYQLPVTGLRFFTVYGPWGRPDMALFQFTRNILAGKPIDVFNYGNHRRDFTYVDDIAGGVIAALDRVAAPDPQWDGDHPDPATSRAPYRLYNIGNNRPVPLMRYIEVLEQCLGRKAEKNLLPLQVGDVPDTWADAEDLVRDVGYRPSTPVEEGVARFVAWYLDYYRGGAPENPRVTTLG
jgi:UDP-glucuronate 4-epimerase